MSTTVTEPAVYRRPDRGLCIAGTRMTLYSLLDYVHAGWSNEKILEYVRISESQLNGALEYIAAHREEVEKEYEQVVKDAEESRRYWEERNKKLLANRPSTLATTNPAAWAKLQEAKKRLGMP